MSISAYFHAEVGEGDVVANNSNSRSVVDIASVRLCSGEELGALCRRRSLRPAKVDIRFIRRKYV